MRSFGSWLRYGVILSFAVLLSACSGMKPEQFADGEPKLVLEEYFDGKVYAWGIFEDRFGQVKRQFQVDIDSRWDGKQLVLDEAFLFDDGERSRRVWTITKHSNERYSGTAADVVGEAEGIASGNALNWRYQMMLKVGDGEWQVSFDDWMFLQPGGVMVNRAVVSKWGVELGQVTLFFTRGEAMRDAPFDLQSVTQ